VPNESPGPSDADVPVVDEGQPAPDNATGMIPDAQHLHDLGWDPAIKDFRPGEAETAGRIEGETGAQLQRFPGDAPDWIGSDGQTYDAVGNFPAEHFDRQWGNLQDRIVDHLDKADYVAVDVSQFTPEQTAKVNEFIAQFGPRVFTVGG
jgi:CdiA C-terminal tRNase domain